MIRPKPEWEYSVKIKKILVNLLAVVLAVAILDAFCWWFYNPVAYVHDDVRATDTVRVPNTFNSRAKEGFAWHMTDANGYNNAEVPGEDGVFVLMMGSSQLEGFNVMLEENAASRLQVNLMENGVEGFVYNIGMSNHMLTRNIANMDRALTHYAPTGYLVLETHDLSIGSSSIENAINDSYRRISATEVPLPDFLAERPLLRALYRQFMSMLEGEETSNYQELKPEYVAQYRTDIQRLMQHVADVAGSHGVTPILYYHPHLLVQADGTARPQTDPNCLAAYADACAATGVVFVDLTQEFLAAYEEAYILPHGFANTAPGTGHLNEEGCRMIAEKLCDTILMLEAEK